ncbi:hypothetical protein [Alkalicoccus saliphilus]|nr:hypothetical protein [Alkalicoccus saliphilus]
MIDLKTKCKPVIGKEVGRSHRHSTSRFILHDGVFSMKRKYFST